MVESALVPWDPFLMKVLLKKETCECCKQCMEPTRKALKKKGDADAWTWNAIQTELKSNKTCVCVFSVGPVHCLQDPQVQISTNFSLKLSLIAIFTHLKFILLQCSQFLAISSIQTYLHCPKSYVKNLNKQLAREARSKEKRKNKKFTPGVSPKEQHLSTIPKSCFFRNDKT